MVDGEEIDYTENNKYLGFHMNNALSTREHMQHNANFAQQTTQDYHNLQREHQYPENITAATFCKNVHRLRSSWPGICTSDLTRAL